MDFIYRKDIFDVITKSLLEQGQSSSSLNYSKLYARCCQKLNKKISHSDFNFNLNGMIKENLLNRKETKDDSKLKIPPVQYSLTDKAKKQYNLKILGIDERILRRKHLYQLLFFF